MFKYSLDNKRYHTLNYFYKNRFNSKVFKVSLNLGLSCPNKENGPGCIFCSKLESGDFAGSIQDQVETQFETIKNVIIKKWPNSKYIAYFQAGTNTYAPLSFLKSQFEKALNIPGVIGLSIATRPDAISDDTLEYLSELNKRTYLTIELGLQSIHDKTLKLIKRGHDLLAFETCLKKLQEKNINVVVHIINGLPNETKEDMLSTIKYLNKLKIDGLKIHMLSITKNTELENIYLTNPFHVLTKEEYIDIVCDQLELLNESVIIHRITGDPVKEDLIAPTWLLKKFCVLNDIDKELLKRNSCQGAKINL